VELIGKLDDTQRRGMVTGRESYGGVTVGPSSVPFMPGMIDLCSYADSWGGGEGVHAFPFSSAPVEHQDVGVAHEPRVAGA